MMLMRRLVVVMLLAVLAWAVWHGAHRAPDLTALQADAERASTLYDAGDWVGSAELYLTAADGAEAADEPALALAWRAQAGVGFKMAGELDAARPLLEAALDESRERGDRRTEGLALGNLARVSGLQDRLDEALGFQDALTELARTQGDAELQVKTLEQAADTALSLADLVGARERLEQALEIDAGLAPDRQRHGPLMRQLAWVAVESGDDEGASELWLQVPASASGTANQARHLGLLGLHRQAADLAREAASLFEAEGERRLPARDRALHLAAASLLRAREMRDSFDMLRVLADAGGDPLAVAPFDVLRGRHAMARQDWDKALEHFDAVAPLAGEIEDGGMLPWLRATTLCFAGRYDEAQQVLIEQARSLTPPPDRPYDTVSAWLLGWALVQQQVADGSDEELLRDVAVSLVPDVTQPIDPRVAALRELCPHPLPSLAWTTLEVHLQQVAQVRRSTDDEVAKAAVGRGVYDTLLWQAREACDRVRPGLLPSTANLPRVQAWTNGDLGPDEAVLSVIMGENRSYLALLTSDQGATTFGIPPRFALRDAMGEVVEALKGSSEIHLASMSHKLTRQILGKRALYDMGERTRLTLILPDDLTPVPPSIWVLDEPLDGVPMSWLVKTHVVSLLPHALAGSSEYARSERWVQMAQPNIDPALLPLSTARMIARYGEGALEPGASRAVPMGTRWTEAEANTARLRSARNLADVLELAVPALGGGRLGGLLCSPLLEPEQAVTAFGDERLGFMPWHRFVDTPLPPSLMLDQSRFDPGDVEHGAAYAATAILQQSDRLLLSRWPLQRVPSEMVLEWFRRGVQGSRPEQPISYAAALAASQRAYLIQAEASGATQLLHPRAWAGWMVFGTN